MGATSIIFIIVLLIVSGLIAWVGDYLGRALGKKRIALFGLRPRYTSILIGVLTGIFITIIVILSLLAASKGVRTMLFRIDETVHRLAEVEQEIQAKTEELNQVRIQNDIQQSLIHEQNLAIEAQIEQISGLTGQLSTMQEELGSMQARIDVKTAEAAGLEAEIRDLNDDVRQLNADADTLRAEYNQIISQKEADISTLNQVIADRQVQVEELNDRVEELNQEIVQLNIRIAQDVKLNEGEQLAAFPLDSRLDRGTLQRMLAEFIGQIPYVYQDLDTGEFPITSNDIVVTNEQLDRAVTHIQALPSEEAIVIVYSASTVRENEPIPVRLEITGNLKIFTRGTVIFSRVYSSPVDAEDPERAVVAGFFSEARNYLVHETGFIPTTSGQVIQATIDEILDMADTLANVGFPAELKMIALADLYKSDFLVYGSEFTVEISRANIDNSP